MMGVIVVVYAAFSRTESENETEIMCKQGMPEAIAIFRVEAAGQAYNQTNEIVCLGGNVNQNAGRSIDVDRRIPNT